MHLSPDSDLTGKPNSSKSPFLAAAWLFLLGVALTLLLFNRPLKNPANSMHMV